MWPYLLDYSRDECKRTLRRLELEAYSSVVSCFRAQGNLSQEKKKMLKELQHMLSISEERHRAEVRRAVNDERLSTVADSNGSSPVTSEWLIEGRRLVPILPRLVPQTAFSHNACQVAKEAADKNATLMNPALTGNKELASQSTITAAPTTMTTVATKPSRPSSPTSNVVVLPSGTSIHIKGMLTPEEDDEPLGRRQRRSISIDGMGAATASTQTQTARVIYTTASSTPGSTSPVKITISKSPQGRAIVSQPGGQPPKVILVTSQSNQQSGVSTMFQRSMSVPVIRASTSTSTSHSGATRTSIIIPGSPGLAHGGTMPGVVTVTTTSITTSTTSNAVTMPTSVVSGSPVFTPSINIGKPRPKMVPRQRFPHTYLFQPQNKPGLVIPMGPGGVQPVAPSPQNLHNIQVKTVPKAPPIHIKQEGGMKIITQTVAGASKILPKPAQLSSSPGTPVVVVNAGSSSAGGSSSVTMVPKTVGSYTSASGKVLNITTPGGRVIATTTKASNVVTVNPKTLQLTAVKSNTGGTTVSKPNVIVVQKTQARRPQLPTQITKGGTTVITSPAAFEKELANFIQKESGRQVSVSISPSGTVTSATAVGGRAPEHRVIITTTGNSDLNRQGTVQKLVSADPDNRTSLLAELIQAAGITQEGGAENSGVCGNEWFEYDVEDTGQSITSDSLPVSTIQSLMGLQNTKIVQRSLSVDEQQGVSQEQYYSLEQAVSLLNCETTEATSMILSQPNQRIFTTVGDGGKATVEIPRRLPSNLVAQQAVGRADIDAPSRLSELSMQPPGSTGGELDPQTGLFYSSGGVAGHQQIMVNTRDGSILTSQGPVTLTRQAQHVVSEGARRVSPITPLPVVVSQGIGRPAVISQTVVTVPVNPPQSLPQPPASSVSLPLQHVDLVRSSLAQAQINLESFDFEDDGMGPYGDLDGDEDSGGMAGDGFVDDQPSLDGCGGEEEIRGNFDAHTALLEESEAAQDGLVVPAVPHGGTGNSHLTDIPPVSICVSVPPLPAAPLSLLTQPQPKQQAPAVTIPHGPGRPPAFIPQQDIKEAKSSGINIITHDQKDMAVMPAASSVPSPAVPTIVNIHPKGSQPPPANSSSKASAPSAMSVVSVALPLTASAPPTVQSMTLAPLPQGSGSNTLVQKNVPLALLSNSSAATNSVIGGLTANNSSATNSIIGGLTANSAATNSVSVSGGMTEKISVVTNSVSGGMAVSSCVMTNSVSGGMAVNSCVVTNSVSGGSPTTFVSVASTSGVRTYSMGAKPLNVTSASGQILETSSSWGSGVSSSTTVGSDFASKLAHSSSASPPALVVRGSNPLSGLGDGAHFRRELVSKGDGENVRVVHADTTESVTVLPLHQTDSTHKTQVLSKSDILPVHRTDNVTTTLVRKSDNMTLLPVHKPDNMTVLPVHNTDTVTVLDSGEVISGAAALVTSLSDVMDFAVRADQDGSMILGEAGSSGADLLDSNLVRQSKRKRRPPSVLEEAAGSSTGGSWVKTAQSILAKVSRYRGTNREKGELNASAWFTQPVDPGDAPDYYSIIKSPMDFGTIRRKLEMAQYVQFDDFHTDMLLVRNNCLTYNPSHTRVYRDCNQVFNYYNQEIEKMVEKSVHSGSPPKKQIRTDKSPAKT